MWVGEVRGLVDQSGLGFCFMGVYLWIGVFGCRLMLRVNMVLEGEAAMAVSFFFKKIK